MGTFWSEILHCPPKYLVVGITVDLILKYCKTKQIKVYKELKVPNFESNHQFSHCISPLLHVSQLLILKYSSTYIYEFNFFMSQRLFSFLVGSIVFLSGSLICSKVHQVHEDILGFLRRGFNQVDHLTTCPGNLLT